MIRPDDDYPEQVQCKPYENFFKAFGTQVCEGLVWDPPGLGGPPHLADPRPPSENDPTGLGTPDVKPSAQSLCLTPLLQNLKTSIFFCPTPTPTPTPDFAKTGPRTRPG